MQGYLRPDGRKGIRNQLLVAYLVECAHHVARLIVDQSGQAGVQLVGFPGCYPNAYALRIMQRLCTHPNVAACCCCPWVARASTGRTRSRHQESGRPVETLVIQECGGTRKTLAAGLAATARIGGKMAEQGRVDMALDELVVGTICGGSDGTSGHFRQPGGGQQLQPLGC